MDINKFNPCQDNQEIFCRYLNRDRFSISRGQRRFWVLEGQKDTIMANEHQRTKKSRYCTSRILTFVFLVLELL